MPHLPSRLAARPLLLVATLALFVGGCAEEEGDIIAPVGFSTSTPTTPPPVATPTGQPEATPLVPSSGGAYELEVGFVRVEGSCGGPASFQDQLRIEIGEAKPPVPSLDPAPTPAGQTMTVLQPSTGDVNTGMIMPDGRFNVGSEKESYSGLLEIDRDEVGTLVRVVLTARNTYQDAQGCTTGYDVSGEVEAR